ncbi:ion channel [Streptomyces sp. NPDC054794]
MSDPVAERPDPAPQKGKRKRVHGRRGARLRPTPRATLIAILRIVLITTGLVTAYYVLPMVERNTLRTSALLAGGLLAVVLFFGWEVRAILRSPYPRLKAVEGLAATLVLFLVLFASAYYVLEGASPGSFTEPLTKTDALYFTLTTFTTVGYGDITASSQPARILTMLQMVGGLLLLGVAVRVLTSAVEIRLRRQHRGPRLGSDEPRDMERRDKEKGA